MRQRVTTAVLFLMLGACTAVTEPVARYTGEVAEPQFAALGDPSPQQIAFVAEREEGPQVWIMATDGSNQRRLTTVAGIHHDFADWSPDGTRLAVTCHAPGPQDDICVVNADGTGYGRFYTPSRDSEPRWSPDGDWLLFYSDRGGSVDLFTMDAATGLVVTPVFASPGPDYNAVWSPDGTQIAFTSTLGGSNYDIYVLSVGSSTLTRMTDHPAQDVTPAWSPDGHWLAFVSERSGAGEIYLMDPLAPLSAPLRVTSDATGPRQNSQPAWSPDSHWLVYSSNVEYGSQYDIFKRSIASPETALKLTQDGASDTAPNWSGGTPSGDPNSKGDCMNGGWSRLGFKNQGQCVRYVETGGDGRG